MTNTFCPLNPELGEEIHMNMSMGTWPVAVLGEYTGELVITNWRWCSCNQVNAHSNGMRVFYPEF